MNKIFVIPIVWLNLFIFSESVNANFTVAQTAGKNNSLQSYRANISVSKLNPTTIDSILISLAQKDSLNTQILQKLNGLTAKLDSLSNVTLENKIARDFFESDITLFTGLITVIVTLWSLFNYFQLKSFFKKEVVSIQKNFENKLNWQQQEFDEAKNKLLSDSRQIKGWVFAEEVRLDDTLKLIAKATEEYELALLLSTRIAKKLFDVDRQRVINALRSGLDSLNKIDTITLPQQHNIEIHDNLNEVLKLDDNEMKDLAFRIKGEFNKKWNQSNADSTDNL